jgi:hypothetical protein
MASLWEWQAAPETHPSRYPICSNNCLALHLKTQTLENEHKKLLKHAARAPFPAGEAPLAAATM